VKLLKGKPVCVALVGGCSRLLDKGLRKVLKGATLSIYSLEL
jgi:hypothetical protein